MQKHTQRFRPHGIAQLFPVLRPHAWFQSGRLLYHSIYLKEKYKLYYVTFCACAETTLCGPQAWQTIESELLFKTACFMDSVLEDERMMQVSLF